MVFCRVDYLMMRLIFIDWPLWHCYLMTDLLLTVLMIYPRLKSHHFQILLVVLKTFLQSGIDTGVTSWNSTLTRFYRFDLFQANIFVGVIDKFMPDCINTYTQQQYQ